MKNKKKYVPSRITTVIIGAQDVITSSNPSHGGSNELPDMTPDD